MLLTVVVAFMLSFFQRFAPAGIAQDLTAAFQTSAASLGILAATYFYVYTVMQIPTGILADTLGPRRVLLAGGLIGGAGSFLFGLAPTLEMALIGRTLIGLGVSVTFICMLKIVAVWYEESRFASTVGICMLIGNLGSVLAGVPLTTMAQVAGWRGVFVGVGVISILLALMCWWLVRDRIDAPNSPAGTPPTARIDRTVILGGLWSVMANRATWPSVIVMLGICGSFFAFAGLWATPWLMQVHGLSRAAASTHLSLYFAGFAVGCFFIGQLSDRLQRRKPVIIIATHIYGALWLLILSCMSLPIWATYLLFILMGMVTSGFTLGWACAKEVNPPLLSGMSTSVANIGGFLGAAILQPLVGSLLDQHWNGTFANGIRIYSHADFQWGFSVMALAAWIGMLATWTLRETRCRNVWVAPKPATE